MRRGEKMRAKYYREEEPRREPEEITELLGSIIAGAGGGARPEAAAIVHEWDSLVSERWRRGVRPVGIRDGVLLVEVDSAATATLLRHDTAAVLGWISDRFGPGLANAVKLRVSRGGQPGKNR